MSIFFYLQNSKFINKRYWPIFTFIDKSELTRLAIAFISNFISSQIKASNLICVNAFITNLQVCTELRYMV